MKYSLSQVLKKTPREIAAKANSMSYTNFLKWQIDRIKEVIAHDIKVAGPDFWSTRNTSKLNYRNKSMKFWEENLNEIKKGSA